MSVSLRRVAMVLFVGILLTGLFARTDVTLPEALRDTVTLSLGVLYEAFPFVVLGTLLATIVQLYVPENFLLRILPKRAIARRAVLSVSGSLLPVCECGNVPLARGLMTKGIAPQDALTFILAAPIINPVTALTTNQAFGSQPLLLPLRLIGAFGISNLLGWLFDRKNSASSMLQKKFMQYCADCNDKHTSARNTTRLSLAQHIRKFADSFQHELVALLPALCTGSFVAGIIQTAVPRSWLTQVASEQPSLYSS